MRPRPERVRLVALDLDGTVVGRDLSVSPRVLDAIARAKSLGVRTTIVTGRMLAATRPFARRLGIEGPIVCYQGAGIYDAASDAELRHIPVSASITERVLGYARERRMHIQLYAGGTYYVESVNDFGRLYAHVSGVEPTVVPSLRAVFDGKPSTKIVIVSSAADAVRIESEMRDLCGKFAYVTRSNPEFTEVLAPGVDKGDALAFVARMLDVPMTETLAVGDSWNDIPLLRAAAYGAVMGDAPSEAVAAADAVVADVAHDGVVEAYERFVFSAPVTSG